MSMDEILKLEEIKARYPSEWVLIDEPQIDEMTRLLGGRVVFHSPSRDEVHRKMLELRLPHFAIRFLGKPPEHLVLIL
jgi:hypothetical protein